MFAHRHQWDGYGGEATTPSSDEDDDDDNVDDDNNDDEVDDGDPDGEVEQLVVGVDETNPWLKSEDPWPHPTDLSPD